MRKRTFDVAMDNTNPIKVGKSNENLSNDEDDELLLDVTCFSLRRKRRRRRSSRSV